MKKFNYDSYMRDNPLLKETSGLGNYTQPETMLEDEGDFEEEEDLFDDWENLPEDVKKLYLKWSAVLGGDDGAYEGMDRYKMMQVMLDQFENLGYTFDYGLDAEPYGLKKMNEDYDYQSAEDFDLDPQDGENDPLGPDEELMEGSGKVMAVKEMIIDKIESAIAKSGLDEEDLSVLRKELARHFGK